MQQLHQLLLEEPVVVTEIEAEERERLDERAAPDHHLRATAREQIERRELLVEADRDSRAEHRHRARQPDALRARCGGGEHDSRSGHREFRAMVLSDPEDVEPDLVGELDLLDEFAQTLLRADRAVSRVREREDADLHARVLAARGVTRVDGRLR